MFDTSTGGKTAQRSGLGLNESFTKNFFMKMKIGKSIVRYCSSFNLFKIWHDFLPLYEKGNFCWPFLDSLPWSNAREETVYGSHSCKFEYVTSKRWSLAYFCFHCLRQYNEWPKSPNLHLSMTLYSDFGGFLGSVSMKRKIKENVSSKFACKICSLTSCVQFFSPNLPRPHEFCCPLER